MLDQNTWKKARAGDVPAFEEIVLQYEKAVYHIAYRMLGNAEDARDLSQEIFIKVYKNLHKCDGMKGLTSWIYTIATHACIDEIRKKKTRIAPDSLDQKRETQEGEVEFQVKSDEPTPEERTVRQEKIQEIQKAVASLPENDRVMIVLRDMQGLSYEEIAQLTRNKLGTVKSRISRARNRLREVLKTGGELK